jgi:tRNA modification GTPase
MYDADDTIVALATPPGRGGLGVVRLSGNRAREIARRLTAGGPELEPRRATLVRVTAAPRPDAPGTAIDEAVATFFPGPASYSGEDVVELSLHGSPVIAAEVIQAAVAVGARMARPGEFTLRAFLNGRLDLTRAEAVHDLVEATTPVQAGVAFDQLSGTLAERIGEIEESLFGLLARLEASGDFPEEGYHFISPEETKGEIDRAAGRIDALLADARRGRLIRDGVAVAIVGRPNVGKSTLFNRLAGADRAIVTAVPGTTRDVLTESVMLLGTRMLLADTAGLRETADPVEREGVARAEKAGGAADVVVVVIDASEALTEADRRVLAATTHRTRVIALNKSDRLDDPHAREMVVREFQTSVGRQEGGARQEGATRLAGGTQALVAVSALTGQGIDDLVMAVAELAGLGRTTEPVAISNLRHIDLLSSSREALERGRAALDELGQTPEEIVSSDLRRAVEALQEVSGKRTTDDLLNEIFSKFCIGK